MKCVKQGETVRRVSDQEASAMVKRGWDYCSKGKWRNASPKRRKKAGVTDERS